MAALCILTWGLSHVYLGLFHDAGLYTLQALAHLKPGPLSQDVFLKFGSQDRFSLFGSLYAGAAAFLGLEPAAASLTLIFQVALVLGAWAVARSVMPAAMALLGVATLIAIPGYYGSQGVFTCIESFLTPRMASEALVLSSIAATLWERKSLGMLLVAAAVLLHPIMAIPGVIMLLYIRLGERKSLPLISLGVFAALVSAALPTTAHWGRFDPEWLALIESRSPYLFVAHWQLEDWARTAVTLCTLLLVVVVTSNARVALLARAALLILVGGLALTWIGCDVLHGVLLTQLQPWRCQWLATVAAALMLPKIVGELWGGRIAERTSALLLLAAWVFASDFYALFAVCACVCSLAFLSKLKPSEARWMFFGSIGLLIVALLWRVASNLEFTDAYYLDPTLPLWLRRATSFAHDGIAPMALIAASWWLTGRRRGRPALIVVAGVALAAGCTLLPSTWARWTHRDYPPSLVKRFSAIREKIATNGEVFWPQSPLGTWLLLERPSYISVIQTSGMVFSRDSALDLKRRSEALNSAVNSASFMSWSTAGTGMELSKSQLQEACRSGAFEFLVTSADLGLEVVAFAPPAAGSATKPVHLYRCRPVATRLLTPQEDSAV